MAGMSQKPAKPIPYWPFAIPVVLSVAAIWQGYVKLGCAAILILLACGYMNWRYNCRLRGEKQP